MEIFHLLPEPPPPPPKMEIKLIRKINLRKDGNRRTPKTPKIAKKHKNARNLVIFWNLGKVKYTIVLEIGCQ